MLEDKSYRLAKRRGYKGEHSSLHGPLEQESLQTESEGGPLGQTLMVEKEARSEQGHHGYRQGPIPFLLKSVAVEKG